MVGKLLADQFLSIERALQFAYIWPNAVLSEKSLEFEESTTNPPRRPATATLSDGYTSKTSDGIRYATPMLGANEFEV